MSESKQNEYLINKIKTASPMQLIIIVYDTAIASLEGVTQDWENKEYTEAAEKILKAQKCIRELKKSLNMDIEEISHSLFSLYRAIDKMMLKIQQERDEALLNKTITMLVELRDTWQEVATKEPNQKQHISHAEGVSYINTYK